MVREKRTLRRLGRPVLWCAVAGGGYAAGSQLAFTVLDATGAGPTFFPSAGLSVALLCLLPRRAWPFVAASIAAIELVVDLVEGLGPLAATGFAVGNTIEPVLGAVLLGATRRSLEIGTWRGLTRFVAAAVLTAPAVGALIGATTAVTAGDTGSWWAVAGRWWLGDGLGVLVIGTALLVWGGRGPRLRQAAAAVALGGVAVLVFWADVVEAGYAGVFALVWVALRWGLRAVTASGVVIAVVATTATAAGRGPWAGTAPASGLVHLQLVLALVLLTTLVLAVTVTERDAAVRGAALAEERRRRAQSVAEAEQAAHGRAKLLRAVADALGATTDVSQIVSAVVDVHDGGLAAVAVGVLGDGEVLRVRTGTGAGTGTETTTPVASDTPEAAVARDGEPRYPATAAILPLRTSGDVFGFLGLYHREPRGFSPAQRTVLLTMAAQVAQAVHRAQLYEAEQRLRLRAEDGEWRQRLIGDLMAAISKPGSMAERAQGLVDTLVPALADFAVVEFGGDDSETPVAVSAHRDQDGRAAFAAWRTGGAGVPALTTVLATGQDLFVPHLSGNPPGPGSLVGVPLTVEGAVQGALLLGHAASGRSFAAGDLELARDIAARAVLVLHAAHSADRERSIALTLQTSQLPRDVPTSRRVAAAARYRPSQRNLSIGGDWYDVVAHPDGRIAITIGDVVGHGLAAAAAMGQMRSAATALILAELGPAAVLDRLDLVAARTAGAEHASALVAELDPAAGRFRYAVAGHPPPLLIAPDGTVALLDQARSPLLCLPPRHGRPEAERTVLPGSALVCYTDGLIEQNRLPAEEAFAELVAAAAEHARRSPGELCDGLLDALVGHLPARDDIAVVCLRFLPAPSAQVERAVVPRRDLSPGRSVAG
ncbi:SpoIIE family protein phosphatase [Amycolatopsis sp. NPDC049252]|uniref:SpoIIE family protein phosphatase n=1 Tax=Amycolatopsis sp. NPDC049252 TaxID=3363933 RepID=UPI003723C68E